MLIIIPVLILMAQASCLGKNSNDTAGKGRARVGTDLASCISSGVVRMELGYSFGRNWSIDGDVGVKLLSMKNTDTETLNHWKDVGHDSIGDSGSAFRERFQEMSIQTRYWPDKAYNGIFLGLGCKINDRQMIPDCCVCLGYVLQIHRRLHASLAFQKGITDMIADNRQSMSDGLRIGISCIF